MWMAPLDGLGIDASTGTFQFHATSERASASE